MDLSVTFLRRLVLAASSFWPLVVFVVLGVVTLLGVEVWRRIAYSRVVRGWRAVEGRLLEARSVSESHAGSDGDRYRQTHYAGRVEVEGSSMFVRVSRRWYARLERVSEDSDSGTGVPIKLLVNPASSLGAVVAGDVDTVVGPRGCLWQLGFALTLFGVLAFVMVLLFVPLG